MSKIIYIMTIVYIVKDNIYYNKSNTYMYYLVKGIYYGKDYVFYDKVSI